MNLLLHICCAPCSVACIEHLRADGIEPTGFWFNPNIHPFTEYKMRKNTLIDYAASIDLKLIVKNEYGLRSFVSAVAPNFEKRCAYCYYSRLAEAAACASENGCDAFTSTLLISPYQKHDLIREIAAEVSQQFSIPFFYRDFRPFFRSGQDKAREAGLYMQKYCGCIFSEEERYRKRKKRSSN